MNDQPNATAGQGAHQEQQDMKRQEQNAELTAGEAEMDDITDGKQDQARREKMSRMEKAEGNR